MKKLTLILGMLLSLNANATGGFSCEFKEGNLEFELGGVTSHGFGSAIVDANAWLMGTMGDDGLIYKADQNFVKANVSQYWNSEGEFRILLYAETNEKSTTVTIKTKAAPNGFDYTGTISIVQTRASGEWSIEDAPITCGIE